VGGGDRGATRGGGPRVPGPESRQSSPESRVPSPGQLLSFISGLLVLFLALNGPLHDLSDDYLFSAHMVQHLVLTMLVPPLLIAGIPGWMLRPALRVPGVYAVARRISTGRAAFAIFSVTMVAWHIPLLYNLAMEHHPIHIVEHLCFLVAATIMWWPIMSTLPELPRLSYPAQLLYVFLLMSPMMMVSAFITYADHVLYPFYAGAPRIWPITALEDQRIGGLIMWIPGGLIFVAVLSVIFFKWVGAGADDTASAQVEYQPTRG
jgi:putative membrane protein